MDTAKSIAKHSSACVGLLLVVGLVGCFGGDEALPETVPATGTVRFRGRPLAEALVTFSDSSGRISLAVTDAAGQFQLKTYLGPNREVEGAIPGDYSVTISKMVPPSGMTDEEYQRKVAEADKIVGSGGVLNPDQQPPAKVQLLPGVYANPQRSKLRQQVKTGVDNAFDFDLK